MKKVRMNICYLYTLYDVHAIAISLFNKMGLGAIDLHEIALRNAYQQTPEQFLLLEEIKNDT